MKTITTAVTFFIAFFLSINFSGVAASSSARPVDYSSSESLFVKGLWISPADVLMGWQKISPDQTDAAITITDSHKELNRRVWTFSTSDIFYRRAFTPFDVTQEDYLNIIRRLHPYAVAYSEGKTSDWARQKIGDTLVFGGSGNGYNIPSWVPSDVLQGVGTHKFFINGKPYDFFNAYVKMIHKIPVRGYILGNILTGSCAEVIWMIKQTNPEYVQLGLEQMRAKAYTDYWKRDARLYKVKFNRWADSIRAVYPHVKIIADVPPTHSNLPSDMEWIKELQSGLKADGVRDYWHLHWTSEGEFSGKIQRDTSIMNDIFRTRIPRLIEKEKRFFPDKELIVDQWSVSLTGDGGKNPYKRTFFGTSFIPRMAQFMIEYNRDHNNIISSAKYENLKQLIGNRDEFSMEYTVTAIVANLFSEPATVLNIQNNMRSIKVFGVKSGNRYKVVVFNDSGRSVQLPKQISCDGRLMNVTVKEALHSPDLTSTIYSSYSTQQEVRPYSVLYAELSVKTE